MSLSKLAKRVGHSRQWIWLYFKQWNLPTRKRKLKKTYEFEGMKYTEDKDGYLRETSGGRLHLHKMLWERAHGKVPEGHEIVFIDGNKKNVSLSNLKVTKKGEVSLAKLHAKDVVHRRFCSNCKTELFRRPKEQLSIFHRRKSCSIECRYALTKGKPRGTRAKILK